MKLINSKDAAELLKVTSQSVRNFARDGVLTLYNRHGRPTQEELVVMFFDRSEVLKLAKARAIVKGKA